MPGYDDHRRRAESVAAVASFLLAVAVWSVTGRGLLAVTAGSLSFVAVTVGNQLPDLDSPTSIPRQRLTRLLQVTLFIGVVAGGTLFQEPALEVAARVLATIGVALAPWVVVGGGVVSLALIAAVAIPRALGRLLPPHRGPLHDVRLWILLVGGCVIVIYGLDISVFGNRSLQRDVFVGATAGGVLLGVLVHLTADQALF